MQTLDLVIVTYNRLDKLKKTLQHYVVQTHAFRNLIIVDNCSTDGTREYLDEWSKENTPFDKIIIHTKENIGGSGGFYLGQKKAMKLRADWIFVADDDAYADPTMVERFYDFIELHDTNAVSAVYAAVLDTDGNICLCHRDRHSVLKNEYHRESAGIEEYEKELFSIDVLSYVGSFLNAKALKSCGLVSPEYFIYYDDTEHSMRLKRYGDIIVVPTIQIIHEGGAESAEQKNVLTWRKYYVQRNTAHMLMKHYPKFRITLVSTLLKSEICRLMHFEKSSEDFRLYRKSVLCAFFGILGKDKIYKPGWCAKSK